MAGVVVVGAGLAGFRTARSLRDSGYQGDVTIVGNEEHLPYDRPPLSKQFLSGEYTAAECRLAGEVGDIDWMLGRSVMGLNRSDCTVSLDDGTDVAYEQLVIATGRRARGWPGPRPAQGVHVLRTLNDVEGLGAALTSAGNVVIVGAGFIGCEVAATLVKRRLSVTVVDVCPHPMPGLGPLAGHHAMDVHVRNGVRWRLSSGVEELTGDTHVTGVLLSSGEHLPADVVLVAIGSTPNVEWLSGAGLDLSRGVVACDLTCTALDEAGAPVANIFAAGDVAAWPHPHADDLAVIEHWSNARDMADCVAVNLQRDLVDRARLRSVPAFWSDQHDVKIKAVGYLRAVDDWTEVARDPARNSLLLEGRRDGTLIGAIGFNMNKAILGYARELRDVPIGGAAR